MLNYYLIFNKNIFVILFEIAAISRGPKQTD